MDGSTKKRPLTPGERERINHAIAEAMAPDDREPWRIIEEDYGGDTDAYLRIMAGWHGVQLDSD